MKSEKGKPFDWISVSGATFSCPNLASGNILYLTESSRLMYTHLPGLPQAPASSSAYRIPSNPSSIPDLDEERGRNLVYILS